MEIKTIAYKKEKVFDYNVNVEESVVWELESSNDVDRFAEWYVSPVLDELENDQADYYADELNTFGALYRNELTEDDFYKNEISIGMTIGEYNHYWTLTI